MHVFIGLGSNLGDRRLHLQRALSGVASLSSTELVSTSFLYESSPLLVHQQPLFLNAAACLRTSLSPHALLRQLKAIEAALGRDLHRGPRYGPRVIDLDVLLYGDATVETDDLTIPHAALYERLFVLKPLNDIAPADLLHPTRRSTVASMLAEVDAAPSTAPRPSSPSTAPFVRRVLPLGSATFTLGERTLVMGILNVTPDSFSDGALYSHSMEAAVTRGLQLLDEGADVVDIGGESTRPGATPVPSDEEMRRVLPVIEALHSARPDAPLSVDTQHSDTAEAAVNAGAVLVNDISGGLADGRMLPVVARLGVAYVCSHTRGSPQTMAGLSSYGDVAAEVRAELDGRVKAALDAGVHRWNLLVDPGLGFAKDAAQNVRDPASARDGWASGRIHRCAHLPSCALLLCASVLACSCSCCATSLECARLCRFRRWWAPRARASSAECYGVRRYHRHGSRGAGDEAAITQSGTNSHHPLRSFPLRR